MRRVNSTLLICNFKYVFNMHLFLRKNDNSGAQMFQMADQSKAKSEKYQWSQNNYPQL